MSTRSFRYSTMVQHFTKGVTASTDRDALAFLEAATIYNTNQQRAIIRLVRDLKRTGLWSKMKAIYPFVGGTATTHKWNLKDPRDSDAAFRLTFSGGWTHSSTGADPNGTSGYANTFITPSSNLLLDSTHISYYSRENGVTGNEVEIAGVNATDGRLFIRLNTSGTSFFTCNTSTAGGGTDYAQFSDSTPAAYYIVSRTTSTQHKTYRNDILKATINRASSGLFTKSLPIAAFNDNGVIKDYTTKQCAFATIGDGLTDTDATNLYNIVDLYQKRLGRAV